MGFHGEVKGRKVKNVDFLLYFLSGFLNIKLVEVMVGT